MRPGRGDGFWICPSRSKTDQFGETWCGYGSFLPFEANELNAAFHVRELELEVPCRGAARDATPLFTDEDGSPFTHGQLDHLLNELLKAAFGPQRAAVYSWHSFRIGLACALHAAGCSDGHIQLICRWASPESLKIYRRVGASENAFWCDRAEKAVIDSLNMANIPIVDNMEGLAAIEVQYGRSACHRRIPDRQSREVAPLPKSARVCAPTAARAEAHDSSSEDDALEEEDEAAGGRRPLPPDVPLSASNARGAKLVCPASLWPDFACGEFGGEGWRCKIVSVPQPNAVRIHFLRAVDERGIPYEDAYVSLTEASTWRRF